MLPVSIVRPAAVVVAGLLLSACGAGTATLRDAQGRLQPCDDGPHCVSSLATDAERRVEPLRYEGSAEDALTRLATVIAAMDGAKVVTRSPGYLHATFTTALMKFVDDVEVVAVAESAGELQLRSSSRIGYHDLGANRKRVDAIRAAFMAKAG